jgi:hypothetical protein
VRGEGGIGRGNLFAGFEWSRCTAESSVWIELKGMSAASGEIGAGCGDAGLLAIDRVVCLPDNGCSRRGSDRAWVVEGRQRCGVVNGLAVGEVAGGPAVIRRTGGSVSNLKKVSSGSLSPR